MSITSLYTGAALAFAVLAAPAAASTVINLTGGEVLGIGSKTGTFDNGTVSGTVEAFTAGFCGALCDPVLTQDASEGIGIARNPFDDPSIDAFQAEAITFVFDEEVIFEAVDFGFVDADDDWSITVDGTTLVDISNEDPFISFGGVTGTTLTISAFFELPEDLVLGEFDDFNIQSITVSVIDDPTIVPLPASAGLLLAGLGGLTLARRRRQR